MSALHAIAPRLAAGRPILLGGDALFALRERGVDLPSGAHIGHALRDQPEVVAAQHDLDLAAGVDVITALTAHTTARALAEIGMAFRAAALTAAAVDLASEAVARAGRQVVVAGVLGGAWSRERVVAPHTRHAARLAAAGCELLLSVGPREEESYAPTTAPMTALVSERATDLPTWAIARLERGCGAAEARARSAEEGGAQALLWSVPDVDAGLDALERAERHGVTLPLGVLVDAPAAEVDLARWAEGVGRLLDAGARVLGGGAGTSTRHTRALAALLDRASGASPWSRAV